MKQQILLFQFKIKRSPDRSESLTEKEKNFLHTFDRCNLKQKKSDRCTQTVQQDFYYSNR